MNTSTQATPTPTPAELMGPLIEALRRMELKSEKDAHDAAVWRRCSLIFKAKYTAMKAKKNVYKTICEVNNLV